MIHPVTTVGELFAAEYPAMVRLAYLMTGSNEAAEELVQESFVKVMHRWQEVRDPGGYLRTTVVNACRSWHRRRTVEWRHERGQARPAAGTDAPDEMADALAALSPKQRAAVVLRFYADLSETDIAEVLGCRPGTVKSLLHRGLGTLREALT